MLRLPLLLCSVACAHAPRPPAPPAVPPPVAPNPTNPAAPLFRSDVPLELELAGPLRAIWRQRADDERFWTEATLSLAGRRVPVLVKVKGRNRARHCEVPPYKIRVYPQTVTGTVLAGQRVLRLFSHCRDVLSYEHRAVEEYLVYRTLNLLTDWSLRARLVRMTYRDTDLDRVETYFAVITENVGQLAARTGWQEVNAAAVGPRAIEPNQAALLGLFNLLIGNTDFSVLRGPPGEECCHNVGLIGSPGGPTIPVPYDFDSAGIVDAPYAEPSPELPITSVRVRHYRGLCVHDNYIPGLLERFMAHRGAIEALYRGQAGLDANRLEDTLEYLAEFYELIADPEAVADDIYGRCR